SLDRADRRVEHRGDLDVRQPAEVGELDHTALLVGKLPQGVADLARLGSAGHLELGPLGRGDQLLDALVADTATVANGDPPQRVDRAVVDDPEYPGAHAAAIAVVARPAAPQREERFLHDFFGERALTA